jgi:predicted CoA-binding protein
MARAISPITEFLSCRRLAVVGASRDPRSFSRSVFVEFKRRGYDVVPVNPVASGTLEGVPFVESVQALRPPADAALLMTPPAVTAQVVKDCAAAGIRRVWMHQGIGVGAATPEAVAYCRAHGITVVEGACPLMYLPGTGFVHRAHRWCRQVLHSGRATAAP